MVLISVLGLDQAFTRIQQAVVVAAIAGNGGLYYHFGVPRVWENRLLQSTG